MKGFLSNLRDGETYFMQTFFPFVKGRALVSEVM
jgi:hypothetical protein